VLASFTQCNALSCASVTYLLFVLSAISAVVASAQAVTNHLASYVIFVFVAQVIAALESTLPHKAVNQASHPAGTASPFFSVLLSVPLHCGI
jgi:hypothetical protein